MDTEVKKEEYEAVLKRITPFGVLRQRSQDLLDFFFYTSKTIHLANASGKLKWREGRKNSLCFRIKLWFTNCRKKNKGRTLKWD